MPAARAASITIYDSAGQSHILTLTFQRTGSKKPLNLFLRGTLERIGPRVLCRRRNGNADSG